MFGSSNTTSGAGSAGTGTGFSFGGGATVSTSQPTKPAFSFGNANTNTNTSTGANTSNGGTSGGFSFGKPAATTNAATPGSSTTPGFSFGNSTTKPSASAGNGGFSFGNSTSNTTVSNTKTGLGTNTTMPSSLGSGNAGFSFGNQNSAQGTNVQPQGASKTTSMFSSQPSFGWSKPGTLTTNTATTTTLPTTTAMTTGPNTSLGLQSAQQGTMNNTRSDYTPTINDKLLKIKNSWDPSNPQCKMVTHVYNRVDPNFSYFNRPENETPEEWENAMANRPKEYNTLPVKCAGFNQLFERNQIQDVHVKETRLLLNDIDNRITKMNEKHDLHSNTLLLKCKMKQKNLNIKLLKIAINLSILKYKGYPLTNDEEILISKFNELLKKLDDPVGLNRVNELWARLASLKEKYPVPIGGDCEPDSVEEGSDSQVIQNMVKVLAKQQQGIQFLYELMEEDENKLNKLL